MGIEFNLWRLHTNSATPIKFNNSITVPFGNNIRNDSFQNNSVERLYDENFIKSAISQNSELKDILKKNKLLVRLNMKELLELKQGHCRESAEICGKIYKMLLPSLKRQVNIKDLKDAAMLHDFGKVLIPPEILNKNGKLTQEEYRIMNLHSELGYQLLKNSGINKEVLSLIRNHHNNLEENKNFVSDLNLQILNIADKYSALTEKRVYKEAMSPQKALIIIYNEVQKGNVHPMLYYSLVMAVKSSEQSVVKM